MRHSQTPADVSASSDVVSFCQAGKLMFNATRRIWTGVSRWDRPVRVTAGRSVQAQHREQGGVDLPLLLDGDSADVVAEPIDVDRADLLDKHPRTTSVDVELGTKRRRSGIGRGRCHENHRARQHRVGLDDHPQTPALLLVSDASGKT
jgi:hypothetical protein